MTSFYAALKPFPLPPTTPLTLELATLNVEPEQPYAAFVHHLYVRPLSLNFESQKMFARARNIACSVELRDCDSGDNKPLQVSCPHHGLIFFWICEAYVVSNLFITRKVRTWYLRRVARLPAMYLLLNCAVVSCLKWHRFSTWDTLKIQNLEMNMQREHRALAVRGNMLVLRFGYCTSAVKESLCKV